MFLLIGEKPTQPITPVINEKPHEVTSTEEEIQPSPSKFTTVESSSDSKHSTTTSAEKKSVTKDNNSTPLHNNTSVKKSAKATPKSLNNSPIPKAKPKLVAPVHKTESSTESNSQSQLVSTKKFVEKKTTTKAEGSTKSPPKSKAKPHTGHSHTNTSSKGKITPKTEKPKTTAKSTTKSSTTVTSSSISTTSEEIKNEEPQGTVVVASKVEVHEGPTVVQKIKKGDLEGITSGPSSPFVTLKSNAQTEETKLTTAPEAQLVLTSSGPAKSEETSEENSDTSLLATIEDKSTTISDTTNEEPAVISSSGVTGPEYDFLSRQPSEVVDETFRVSRRSI